jgi:hypothetical protein
VTSCSNCSNWVTARKTKYDDGSEVENFRAADGHGLCELLNIDTKPEFGCNSFAQGVSSVRMVRKVGAPWQHWTMVACPVCVAKGLVPDGARCQCAGTGKVRRYDDGFVGDEKTRTHPTERALGLGPKPTCGSCSREVEIMWVACPFCGGRLEPPAKTEIVDNPMGGTNAAASAMAKAIADREMAAAIEVEASLRQV